MATASAAASRWCLPRFSVGLSVRQEGALPRRAQRMRKWPCASRDVRLFRPRCCGDPSTLALRHYRVCCRSRSWRVMLLRACPVRLVRGPSTVRRRRRWRRLLRVRVALHRHLRGEFHRLQLLRPSWGVRGRRPACLLTRPRAVNLHADARHREYGAPSCRGALMDT